MIPDIIKEFINDVNNYYDDSINDWENYKLNPTRQSLQSYKLKYTHIKKRLGKNTKLETIKSSKISIIGFLKFSEKRSSDKRKYTDEEKNIIFEYHINKIKGIYKHAQALKTGYCNLKIMSAFSKNSLTFAITKNPHWKQINSGFSVS